jgi:hypothetical protein
LREVELAADPQVLASSLADRLAGVPDPRHARGRRHRLAVVLVLTACATLVVGNDCMTTGAPYDSNGDSDGLGRRPLPVDACRRSSEPGDSNGRRWTERAELTNGGSLHEFGPVLLLLPGG